MDFNHLPLTTEDGTQVNLDALYKIAPSCFTEARDEKTGALRHVVDFKKLRQLLGDDTVEDEPEAYDFTWVGKQAARREAASSINKTLRPVPQNSSDWDNTQNIYIEGDNLEALKLLRKSYLGKIKMMYLDPPYNTGNDFIYHDDFKQNSEEFNEEAGIIDANGNRLINLSSEYYKNTINNGKFHSDWCSMIYPRLQVARALLKDDGVILISIDDKEIENLRKICDEIFGSDNFVAQIIWRGGRRNLAKFISTSHEYMLMYAKDLSYCAEHNVVWLEKKNGLKAIYSAAEEFVKATNGDYGKASQMLKEWYKKLPDDDPSKDNKHYSWIDKNGVYFASDISRGGGGGPRWSIVNPNTGNVVATPSRGWSYATKEALLADIKKGLVHFNGDGVPCKKRYLKDNEYQLLETVFYKDRRGSSKRLRKLLGGDYFPFPKDEYVLEHFIKSFTNSNDNDIVLDFFSGSASTAHAVMLANKEDKGNRKFIMVQLQEPTEEDSDAFKDGYTNICQIGEERIRRAGRQIKDEIEEDEPNLFGKDTDDKYELDTGFRVFRVDSSNMKDVYFAPKDLKPQQLELFADNVKEDRTELDLLYGCMVDWGVQLSLPLTTETIDGVTVYTVNDGDLVACFGKPLTDNVVKAMADKAPLRVLFRDNCFEKDEQKINIFEQFKQLLGWSDDEALNNIRVI